MTPCVEGRRKVKQGTLLVSQNARNCLSVNSPLSGIAGYGTKCHGIDPSNSCASMRYGVVPRNSQGSDALIKMPNAEDNRIIYGIIYT